MEKFIVSEWFANRAKLNIQTYEVEGIEFEIMALNSSIIDDVKSCVSYEEMVSLAADEGISYNRKRVADDEELSKDIDLLWGLDSMDVDSDPCIKYRLGEKVCEISGLESTLQDMLESEEKKRVEELKEQGHIDGDGETPNVTLDQLNDDANVASHVAA
jgi:hypothetical protein